MQKKRNGINVKRILIIFVLVLIVAAILTISVFVVQYIASKQYLNSIEKALMILPNESIEEISPELINEILSGNKNSSKIEEILNKYGVDEFSIMNTLNGNKYITIMMIFFIIIGSIISFILLVFLYFYIKKYDNKIQDITEYSERVVNGNYELCIIDNEEGNLSILKNKIYDVVVLLREKGELLNEEKQELKKLMEDISHQFKTPLTSLGLLNELLYNDKLSKEKKIEFLNNMRKELNKLEWLITTLLKLSQFDAKSINLKSDNVNIYELINKSINYFEIMSEIKEVNITIKNNNEVYLICDYNWTIEALNNIIKNSIEHNGKNIEIEYEENPLYVELKVRDDGEGIKHEDLPYIFNRFYKAKNSKSNSIGIGLALVKEIVESQNGEIYVKSEENVFTEFKMKFYKIK